MIDTWNEYFIPGTEVLENKFGIKDKKELEEKERKVTFKKLAKLSLEPVNGNFDTKHLLDIHKYLFEDVYPFAGEYRNCTMAKKRDFMPPEEIKSYLEETLRTANEDVKNIYSLDHFSFFLSGLYYDLMYVHPFREGNGRSIREFLREFVREKSKNLPYAYELDFSKVTPKEALEAVEQKYVSPSLLPELFRKALVPVTYKDEKAKEYIVN